MKNLVKIAIAAGVVCVAATSKVIFDLVKENKEEKWDLVQKVHDAELERDRAIESKWEADNELADRIFGGVCDFFGDEDANEFIENFIEENAGMNLKIEGFY